MDDELREEVQRETARRIDAITAVPGAILKYDLDGDGTIDDREWEILRSTIEARVVRELGGGATDEVEQERPADEFEAEDTDEWEPQDEVDPNLDLPVMEVIDERYEVLKELGRGAQGQTLLARRREDGDYVALKELSFTSLDSWKSLELFQREARTLRQLEHPAIPEFVDSFHVDIEGSPSRFFIAQEFVSGDNLAVLLARGTRWETDELHRLTRDMLDVLDYLHSTSPPIIHRDIKPSNIIRRLDGRHALVDFGGVQVVLPDDVGGSTVVGTSGYMPPEQLTGHAVPQSDLYGLGTTLVHLVTSVQPSHLPRARLKLDWRDRATISGRWADFVDRLIEPVVEDRFEAAEIALAALPSPESRALARRDHEGALDTLTPGSHTHGGARITVTGDTMEIDTSPRLLGSLVRRSSEATLGVVAGIAFFAFVIGLLAAGPGVVLVVLGVLVTLVAAAASGQSNETLTLRRDGRFELTRTQGNTTTKSTGRLLNVQESVGTVEIVTDVERVRFAEACRPQTHRWLVEKMRAFVDD